MTTPPFFPGFDGLMTLSRREGVDIRPTLLRVLTDLYVQANAHSGDEERQFVELTSRLIDEVDDATRAAVRARLAIYPGTPAEVLTKARAEARRSRSARAARARDSRQPRPRRRRSSRRREAQLRMQSNLSMQPKDAAEINDMFSRASSSERALILHNLQDTPLRASARIPAARARRAIETLEMAAFAVDVENFTLELGETLILPWRVAAQVVNDPGGEPLACAARALDMPGPVFQRVLLFLKPEFGTSVQHRLPAVAAVRPIERAIRPGHAGGLARLDDGGHPRQIPPRTLRRRAQPRARRRRRKRARRRNRPARASCRARVAGFGASGHRPRQIEKMPPCPVLGLDDPGIRVEPDFPGETLFHRGFRRPAPSMSA